MEYIKLNDVKLPRPNDFSMTEEPNIVSEYTTIFGNYLADYRGWKYADNTLKWDILDERLLNKMMDVTRPGEIYTLEFPDVDNKTKKVNAITTSRVKAKSRFVHNGVPMWSDVEIGIRFPDVYYY